MAQPRRAFGIPLSVLDAISLPPLNVAEVLSARSELAYRNVRWVQVLHWPAAEFVRPGDLVLTTAVAPSLHDAREFLQAVARSDAAGLVLSLPPSIDRTAMLPAVVELAQERGLPVLAVPWEVPFADITRSVLTRLMAGACQADDPACAVRHFRAPSLVREPDVSQELARAMALHQDSLEVQVALGRPSENRAATSAFAHTVATLTQLAGQENLQLRVCHRPQVALLVLEAAPNASALHDLVDRSRRLTQDTTTHWVIADRYEEHARGAGADGTAPETGPLHVGRTIMQKRGTWVASQSLESLFVLGAMAQNPLIIPVVGDCVGPLVDYDRQHRRNLLETLEVFLDESCNTSAAARRLFLNRHSLMYRLRKIEELTGLSLKEPADRFFLHASVRLYRFGLIDGVAPA